MMRQLCPFCFLVVAAAWALPAAGGEGRVPGGLFPVTVPIGSGVLQVSDLHSIAYTVHGNPKGKPVFVLHGGPGVGSYPRLMQYFNPEKFLIVLHDQRGAGRSRPAGEIRENTTWHLVADIERLRKHLGIDGKILVFGGSWGSTLALAYAEKHPEHVSGMIIRGVHTGERNEINNGFVGPTMRRFFPDAAARLDAVLPPDLKAFEPKYLLDLFKNADDATVKQVGHAWIRVAVKAGAMHTPDEKVEQGWGDFDPRPGAIIDCHYASNGCFLEEGQLVRDGHKLEGIPVTIINGRYDVVCPPILAWRVHQAIPGSKLHIIEEAGHSEAEPGTTDALLEAVAEFE